MPLEQSKSRGGEWREEEEEEGRWISIKETPGGTRDVGANCERDGEEGDGDTELETPSLPSLPSPSPVVEEFAVALDPLGILVGGLNGEYACCACA